MLLRAALVPLYAYRLTGGTDEGEYKTWMQGIHEHGILNVFRTTPTDYVGYHWILWLITLAYGWFGGSSYGDTAPALHVMIKLPGILFDGVLIALIYMITQRFVDAQPQRPASRATALGLPLIAAAVIAFQPAVVYDSAVWGQTDSVISVFMLASILFATRRMPIAAGACWALGFIVKPQPIVIAPLIAVLTFQRGDWRSLLKMTAAGLAVGLIVTGPWIVHGDLLRIGRIYKTLANEDLGRLSGNSWNIWWFRDVAAHPRPHDALFAQLSQPTYRITGTLLSGAAGLLALAYVWTKPNLERALIAAAYIVFAFYMLPVSSHDRYLYPLFALLLPVAMVQRRWFWLYGLLSVTFFVSLILSAPPVRGGTETVFESPVTLAGAALNVAIFATYTGIIARDAFISIREREADGAVDAASSA